ncbi:C40 family peptidase [Streptomyces lavendulae]|uniref:C40 family peptidase n=1 Tax=Streptomyces lavendulae TaxID=1914 RepID=UPI00382615C4
MSNRIRVHTRRHAVRVPARERTLVTQSPGIMKAPRTRRHRRPLPTAAIVCLLTFTGFGATVTTAGTAQASAVSIKALEIAASKQGSPYRWGATGPRVFDCSGLTLYSFKQVGRNLPRTASQQYGYTRHISREARAAGDLVFFASKQGIYHVGMYAGKGMIWHAPKTGTVVRLERIWTDNVLYGRVD